MKKVHALIIFVTIAGISFSAGISWERSNADDLKTQIFKSTEMEAINENWGNIVLFTDDKVSTYGTENIVSGIAEIKPGQQIHPAHKHTEEEFLFVMEGSGTWSINGEESQATAGDLMYAQPWDLHGITNTGTETMKFFFVKWNNKGVERPVEGN
ncbi:MAG: cupin domain-containing protein [Cyclobacteriaceae bacterium]